MGAPSALRHVEDLAPRRSRESPLPTILLAAATFVAAGLVAWAIGGGKKWQAIALLGMFSSAGLAVWLVAEHRFVDFAVWLMTLVAPVALETRVWHRVGTATPLVGGWPASYILDFRDLVIYVIYAIWGFDLLLHRAPPIRRLGWTGAWAGVFLLAGVVSFTASPDPTSSFVEWTRPLHFVALFVYLSKRVDRAVLLRWLLVAIAIHVWVEVVVSALQYAVGSSLGLEKLGERPAALTFDTPHGADVRAGGLMGHPNDLALYFDLMAPILLAQVLKSGQSVVRWLFWAATLAGLAFGLLVTFSRAGWLCAFASSLLVFHWSMRRAGRPRIVSLGLPVGAAVAAFVLLLATWEPFRARLFSPDYGSTTTRWQQFETALNVIRHRWWCGTGIGAYCESAWLFNAGSGDLQSVTYRVHNGSLLVIAELGLLGGLAYHAWLWLVVRQGWRLMQSLRDPELWAVATGCVAGLAAWFAKSMYNVHTPTTDVSIWHVAALVLVAGNCARRVAADDDSARTVEGTSELALPTPSPGGSGPWRPPT